MNQQKYLRLLIIEIELHGYVNESKRRPLKKFSHFTFIVIKTNSYKLKLSLRLSYMSWEAIETYCYQLYGVQQQKNDKNRQKQKKTI